MNTLSGVIINTRVYGVLLLVMIQVHIISVCPTITKRGSNNKMIYRRGSIVYFSQIPEIMLSQTAARSATGLLQRLKEMLILKLFAHSAHNWLEHTKNYSVTYVQHLKSVSGHCTLKLGKKCVQLPKEALCSTIQYCT